MKREMRIDDARAVIWPFREIKGQTMGRLLDDGMISLQDLGYAAERAWDERVRASAKTLLLFKVSQQGDTTTDSIGPLQVISSGRRTFAERRQLLLAIVGGSVLGFIVGCYVIWSIYWVFLRSSSENSSDSVENPILFALALVIVVAITLLGLFSLDRLLEWLVLRPLSKQMELYRKGQLGEERMVTAMYHFLDAEWKLYRNVVLPGTRYDLDGILISPHGVWCLEVKSYSGTYKNQGDQWEYRYGNRWLRALGNPSKQAKRQAAAFNRVLKQNGIQQWVTPVVVWANPESEVITELPSVDVWTLENAGDHIQTLSQERPVPPEQYQEIVDVLDDLIARDKVMNQ